MAIVRGIASLLMESGEVDGFSGSCVQLGVQGITFSREAMQAIAATRKFCLKTPARETEVLSGQEFFALLGFGIVDAIDASAYEGANIIHDMNQELTDPGLQDRYDLVFDGGTMEHVFHVPTFLRNVGYLCKPNGRIVHVVPCSNMIDHGFYCFSPGLFRDYYLTNGFELARLLLLRYSSEQLSCLDVRDSAGSLDPSCFSDGFTYLLYCEVRKVQGATIARIPQQGGYVTSWQSEKVNATLPKLPSDLAQSLKDALRWSGTFLFVRKMYHSARLWRARQRLDWFRV